MTQISDERLKQIAEKIVFSLNKMLGPQVEGGRTIPDEEIVSRHLRSLVTEAQKPTVPEACHAVPINKPIQSIIVTETGGLRITYMDGSYDCGKFGELVSRPPASPAEAETLKIPVGLSYADYLHIFACIDQGCPTCAALRKRLGVYQPHSAEELKNFQPSSAWHQTVEPLPNGQKATWTPKNITCPNCNEVFGLAAGQKATWTPTVPQCGHRFGSFDKQPTPAPRPITAGQIEDLLHKNTHILRKKDKPIEGSVALHTLPDSPRIDLVSLAARINEHFGVKE